MGFFKKDKQVDKNMVTKKKSPTPNAINEDDLLSIAGGQEFYGANEKIKNINNVKNITKK